MMDNLGEQIRVMGIAYILLNKQRVVEDLSLIASELFEVTKGQSLFDNSGIYFIDEDYQHIDFEIQYRRWAESGVVQQGELGICAPERNVTWLKVRLIPYRDFFILQLDNIDELIGSRRLNRQLSMQDPHTGLYYREAFLQQISLKKTHGTVCCVRICNYQRMNEIWGVAVANLVFMEILARVQMRWETALCAKHSTDSFSVFVSHDQVVDIEEMYGLLNDPFCFNGHSFYSNVALGYYKEGSNDDHEQSLNKSEMAILDGLSERGRLVEFRESLAQQIEHQNNLETAFRSALITQAKQEQFYVVFQPIHETTDGHVVGAECLMRWTPDNKPVSPVEFIPIAEKIGEVSELTKINILKLGELIRRLKEKQLVTESMRFAINISVVEILDVEFATKITECILAAGLKPQNIKLELTESALIDNFNYVNKVLQQLQGIGYRISIDDFGTGFSSLSYLCRLSFDEIKIDRAFVTDVVHDGRLQSVYNSIVSLAQNLGKPVVAEGVEDLEQLNYAKEKGTHYIQGYYFSKPLKMDEYIEYLESYRT